MEFMIKLTSSTLGAFVCFIMVLALTSLYNIVFTPIALSLAVEISIIPAILFFVYDFLKD